jgi:hypothetical protein
MAKHKVTHYLRYRDLISSATSTSPHPDALDDCRAVNLRALREFLDYLDEPITPAPSTADLPPIE